MRLLERNLKTFYYAAYISTSSVTDEYGNETGESTVTYSTPVACKGNISAAKGTAEVREFGEDIGYDRVLIVANPDTPINEQSILWVDCQPTNNHPHDYIVRRVARSLNHASIAISKVTVS